MRAFEDFMRDLRVLRSQAGDPSLRDVATFSRGNVSAASLSTYLKGDRLPPWRFVETYLSALLAFSDRRGSSDLQSVAQALTVDFSLWKGRHQTLVAIQEDLNNAKEINARKFNIVPWVAFRRWNVVATVQVSLDTTLSDFLDEIWWQIEKACKEEFFRHPSIAPYTYGDTWRIGWTNASDGYRFDILESETSFENPDLRLARLHLPTNSSRLHVHCDRLTPLSGPLLVNPKG